MSEPRRYQICSRCVMDTTDPDITFDGAGQCNHCTQFDGDRAALPKLQPDWRGRLDAMVADVKVRATGRRYDCLIGLSGGWDSSYTAWVIVKELGLKPLAVHVDNGWNSELAVNNIENIVERLDIDLITVVLDWQEFRSLQVAYLRSGTPDIEIPTDHAIVASMHNTAQRHAVATILRGGNFLTESVGCAAWSDGHYDWHYIRAINERFGNRRLATFPRRDFFSPLARPPFYAVKQYDLLDYWPFERAEAEALMQRELGWRAYGHKHHESTYTKFAHGIYLMRRFGYDKRRTHLSSLVLSGVVSREAALAQLQQPPVMPDEEPEIVAYVMKKLGLTAADYAAIMAAPIKRYTDYPNVHTIRFGSPLYKSARTLYRRTLKPLLSPLMSR
jgi:N-acetyl sugar amidotransferase